MPKNYARIEAKISRHNRQKLEILRKELIEKTGKHLSMGKLVEKILEQFLDQETCLSAEEK